MNATLTPPTVREQIVAFADLHGYHRQICSKLNPKETFVFLSEYYAAVQHVLGDSDGRIVKFIGDSVLLLFPATHPDDAVEVLRKLKSAVDAFLAQGGYESRLRIKAHIGEVAAGQIGGGELERFDVCGIAVNRAALLHDGEWVLSDELRQKIRL